ncbi:arginine:ornithine antiporter [Salmonella enterica]|nr:arginine:ornithine antiporter [Salmonella enterica]
MKRGVFLFWGTLDLLYLIRFVWVNFDRGRIPIIADIQSFSQQEQPFWFAGLLFGLSVLLTLSIVVSAFLFLRGHRWARVLAYAQEPLRLLLIVPSLSFVPWFIAYSDTRSPALNFAFLLGSEALKVLTLYWCARARYSHTILK